MSEDEVRDQLRAEVDRLAEEVEALQKLDMDAILATTGRRSGGGKKGKDKHTPSWVKEWNAKNATQPAQHVVKDGIKDLPVVLKDLKERPPIVWEGRPETDFVGIGPGQPLILRDEGAPKPKRKQMTAMNKVWRYRNFQPCLHCSEYGADGKIAKGTYDTWEARNDPHGDGPTIVHAEIWCHTCGAVDHEVSDRAPAHIGSWAPPKETEKERQLRQARREYRWERAIYALVQGPKTAAELCIWFREVEKYEVVDFPMIGIQLKKMRDKGLVVLRDGKWWEKEDYDFMMKERKKTTK